MTTKTFDLTKFRKGLTKAITGIGVGFHDPTDWISTGNFALNYLISGSFYKGVPLGKVTTFAGESGCLPGSASITIQENDATRLVTVDELKQLYLNNAEFKLYTPDGYVPINNWFDKGTLEMVSLTAESGLRTTCAINHLIQLDTFEWVPAGALSIGDTVITVESDCDRIVDVRLAEPEECFDFTVDHPNHRYWGDGFSSHNSGKSYICSGNIVKNAQQQGIFVILIDSENALDEAWLHALGVDTSEDKLLKLSMAMIDDVAKTLSEFMKEYKEMEDKPKVLFVIDSLGMLLTPTDVAQFEAGDLKGDMGRKAKALIALVRNCVNMFGSYNIGLVATNHTYASQNIYSPDPAISGGCGFVYASSIVVSLQKLKLREDEEGNKTTTVNGIRAGCKVLKTRYAKPFEDIELQIPYTTGMSPYSGLFDLLDKKQLLVKSGYSYIFTDKNGVEHKYLKKDWNRNKDGIFDLVIAELEEKATDSIADVFDEYGGNIDDIEESEEIMEEDNE